MHRNLTTASPAHPQEGRGESSTLQLLRLRYRCNYISVEQLLQDHLPHIGTTKGLLRAIEAGRVTIQLDRLGEGRKAPRIIYLRDLAAFLDQSEKTAATVAA